MEERERCYFLVLSRTPDESVQLINYILVLGRLKHRVQAPTLSEVHFSLFKLVIEL
jgi:hypothetical protein